MSLLRSFHLFDNLYLSGASSNYNISKMDLISNFFHTAVHNPSWWTWPLIVYGSIEISFYLIFHFHLVPLANQRTPPQPFRAFGCHDGKDRFMLLRRILDRLERTCAATGEDITYLRFAYCGTVGEANPALGLDHGIVRTLWLTPDEVRQSSERHRSPLVLRCMEDHLAGRRYPLETISTDPSVLR